MWGESYPVIFLLLQPCVPPWTAAQVLVYILSWEKSSFKRIRSFDKRNLILFFTIVWEHSTRKQNYFWFVQGWAMDNLCLTMILSHTHIVCLMVLLLIHTALSERKIGLFCLWESIWRSWVQKWSSVTGAQMVWINLSALKQDNHSCANKQIILTLNWDRSGTNCSMSVFSQMTESQEDLHWETQISRMHFRHKANNSSVWTSDFPTDIKNILNLPVFQFPQLFPSAFAHIPCCFSPLPKTMKFLSKMLSAFISRH